MIAYLIVSMRNEESSDYQLLIEEGEIIEEKKNTRTTNYKNGMTLLMIIMSFIPIEIPFLREIQTILTALLMCLPPPLDDSNHHSWSLIESKIMNSFGNISYSLYLIHWPIYAYWKSNLSNGDIYNWHLFIALFISITLSILSYEFFEKYVFSFKYPEMRQGKAEHLNREWSIMDIKNLKSPFCEQRVENTILGYCTHKGLDTKNGKYKLMLIGNSWAANHATLFHEECGHKANRIVQESLVNCEPLQHTESKEVCAKGLKTFEMEVAEEKPDYLFIFSRFIDIGDPMPPNVTSLDQDPIYREMKTQLDLYLKAVKNKIYLMNQIARFDLKKGGLIAKAAVEKHKLVAFDKSLVARDSKMARLRYEKLVSECSKCVLFDYKPYFFNETTQTWRFYNEQQAGLTYLTNGIHLSFHGLELIRPVIRDICNSL
uniref:SGNH domain-containing protein n=1 Tax=Caenorhabditis tropicalis TaxID=1561998 RepID=A0A1I7UEC3_9PELO